MFVMIASAPSSGSTLLADLLDSTPYSVCGDELNLFSNRLFFGDFNRFKRHPFRLGCNSSIYTREVHLATRRLIGYGLDRRSFRILIASCGSSREFIQRFAAHFFDWRDKGDGHLFFEKTPQNVNTIGHVLDHLPDARILFLVRNPAYVYDSVLRRGFPPFISLATWLVDAAALLRWWPDPRLHLLKYEDLVSQPFVLLSGLIEGLGGPSIPEAELQRYYENNRYRRTYRRLESWGVQTYGAIKNANDKPLADSVLDAMATLMHARVDERYAQIHDIANTAFPEALDALGYREAVEEVLSGRRVAPRKGWRDYKQLLKKWGADMLMGEARLRDLDSYINPLRF